MLRRIRDIIDEGTYVTLYNALIQPHLEYCSETWGTTYKCNLNILKKLQKRIIRKIEYKSCRDSTKPLFAKYKFYL